MKKTAHVGKMSKQTRQIFDDRQRVEKTCSLFRLNVIVILLIVMVCALLAIVGVPRVVAVFGVAERESAGHETVNTSYDSSNHTTLSEIKLGGTAAFTDTKQLYTDFCYVEKLGFHTQPPYQIASSQVFYYDNNAVNLPQAACNDVIAKFTPSKDVLTYFYQPIYPCDGIASYPPQPTPLPNPPTIQVLNTPIQTARCYFKSWMDWRAITYRNSRQWRMQQIAYTCDAGFRRVNELYMIALGTYFLYQGVGDVFDITLSSGVTFRAVVGDIKSDRHTDATNRFHLTDGSVIEFVIDRYVMCRSVLSRGDVSVAGFEGEVVSINRLPELFIAV